MNCIFVRQSKQLGFGHAVLCAELAVGDVTFAVLLADDFLAYEGAGVMADLVKGYEASGRTQLSVVEVDGPVISKIRCGETRRLLRQRPTWLLCAHARHLCNAVLPSA